MAACARFRSCSFLLITLMSCALSVAGCRTFERDDPDLPNLYAVSDSLYRGGQPSHEGWELLKRMGIKTVVNLRSTQPNRARLNELGFQYENYPITALTPSEEEVIWFLRIATDEERTPVFVYCTYGSDRTGYMVAMYRVVIERWDRERAIEEMTERGKGFLPIFTNLSNFIRDADIEAIRAAVDAPQSTGS